jgi:hypothetical protein
VADPLVEFFAGRGAPGSHDGYRRIAALRRLGRDTARIECWAWHVAEAVLASWRGVRAVHWWRSKKLCWFVNGSRGPPELLPARSRNVAASLALLHSASSTQATGTLTY